MRAFYTGLFNLIRGVARDTRLCGSLATVHPPLSCACDAVPPAIARDNHITITVIKL